MGVSWQNSTKIIEHKKLKSENAGPDARHKKRRDVPGGVVEEDICDHGMSRSREGRRG